MFKKQIYNHAPWADFDDPDHYDSVCESYYQEKESSREWVEGIIDAIYKTGSVSDLENCLDELCSFYDIRLPNTEALLEKKNQNKQMHWYLGYQRALIENARVK